MILQNAGLRPLEHLLAWQLHYGTWLACLVIALGLGAAFFGGSAGEPIVNAGIALFILLPVLRLALMLVIFLRTRDYRFGVIAAVVLIIIGLSLTLGLLASA